MKDRLGVWGITEYISSAIRGLGGSYMRPPSENALVTGSGMARAFRGVTALVGKVGSRVFFNTDQGYAGLGTAIANGVGNVFKVRSLLMYIGSGQVYFNGLILTGIIASGILSYVKKSGGVYAAGAGLGPYQAGHAQPSAPTIYAKTTPSAGQTAMTGAVTVVIWRLDNVSGQPSLKSLPSNVLTLSNQSVIVQCPLPDSNNQTHWGIGCVKIGFADLGNHYLLPTSLNGEVAESYLAYTRTVTGASIVNSSNVVNVTDADVADQFTSADIGRRIAFGTFDSWITAINTAQQVQVHDTNSSGSTISGDATVTHAVEGITRAIEISWSNGALLKELAPDKAFPPTSAQFAGVLNDTLFLDSDGIIYIGEPGFIGSFPPSNALFANEPAVSYVGGTDGVKWRIGKHTVGILAYVGGSPAIEYQELWDNIGIAYQQNAATGANGRLMLWADKPIVMGANLQPDEAFDEQVTKVWTEFEGWENQTEGSPVCPGYDGRGKYEVWCYQKKVMALFKPTGKWCAPIDLTGKVSGNIVAAVTVNKQLYLSCSDSSVLTIYKFDVGSGSVMVVQTDDLPEGYGDTISEFYIRGRVDNTLNPVRLEVIKNFTNDNTADSNPILISNRTLSSNGYYALRTREKQVINAKTHAIRVTMTSAGGTTVNGQPVDAGVDVIETLGERSQVLIS